MSFRIDLETPPEQRWLPILKIYKYKIKAAHDQLFLNFGDSKWIQLASKLITTSSYFGYVKYSKEIQSISEVCNINFGDLVLAQIIYELSACCTSCIYKDPNSNETIHFRTMDWPLKTLANLTIKVDFYSQSQLLYSCVTWAGFVGIMTAVKPDVCSIALNYRKSNGNIWTNIKALVRGKWPASYLIRFALENAHNFGMIKDILSTSELVAPCYFILGHPYIISKSIIIVRDPNSYFLKLFNSGRLIQTNHDPDTNNINILYSHEREQVCNDFLDSKMAVLRKYPVINEETVFYLNLYPGKGILGPLFVIGL